METKDFLKRRRLELGLSQLDVARAVGVSEGTISRWESGNIANMRRDRIYALSKVLQIEPSRLIFGEPDKTSPGVAAQEEISQDSAPGPQTEEERRFMEMYKALSPERRQAVSELMKAMLDK